LLEELKRDVEKGRRRISGWTSEKYIVNEMGLLARKRVQWKDFVIMVMNLRVP
jgi:hypothetical protein